MVLESAIERSIFIAQNDFQLETSFVPFFLMMETTTVFAHKLSDLAPLYYMILFERNVDLPTLLQPPNPRCCVAVSVGTAGSHQF